MTSGFVGRSAELGELVARLDDALAGRAAVVVLAGEPGIGKTRLVGELARLAGARDVPALWGRCTDEEGAPAYWPWRLVLRSWIAGADPAEAAAMLGDGAADLARIAPEVARLAGCAPAASASGPEQRFALFDVTARFLAGLAARTGLLVVLDDVQWADPASLALLTHVARETSTARLIVVATCRPAELAADPARADAVAELVGRPSGLRMEIGGLSVAEVGVALAERLGAVPAPAVVAAVAQRTGGNPFFVGELGRMLRSDPDATLVPAAVRDVVRRRLHRLPPRCRELLATAAVAGAELDLALIGAVDGAPADAVLDDLRPALEDGVLDRPPGRVGLRFAHDLVREALLGGLTDGERTRIHHRVAAALEPSADDPDVLPELAHHALAALPLGDGAVAVAWARRAAELAMAQLAYEEAARLYGRSVEVGRGVLPAAQRVDLLIAMAHAQGRSHDVAAAIASCTEAAELARHVGDAAALGRAALVLQGVSELEWLQAVRGMCEEALRGLGEGDSPLRAQLLAQLAHSMLLSPMADEMADASAQALAMAERLDDPASLVSALRARQLARSCAEGNAERLVLGGRMLAVAARSGDPDDVMWGHLWRFDALLQAGRVADADAELDRLAPVVDRLRQPMARLHLLRSRGAPAFGRGRFDEMTRINDETVAISERGRHVGAQMTALGVRFSLAALTGADVSDDLWIEDMAELQAPYAALMRCGLGLWHLSRGRADDARRHYASLPPVGSPRIPPYMALVTETLRAQLAADLGDAAVSEAVHRWLTPHAHLHAVGGAGAVTTSGSVQLYLGIAATGAGRADAAVRHLRSAITVNDAAGLVPFATMARFRLAVALQRRGRAGDVDEATAVLAAADGAAERLGMAPLRARIAELTGTLRDGGVLSRRETEIAELVGRGLTNRQIAAAAYISERTVESHVQHVLAKLGFTGRSQIAAWVARGRH